MMKRLVLQTFNKYVALLSNIPPIPVIYVLSVLYYEQL